MPEPKGPEFRQHAVELARRLENPIAQIAQIARELGAVESGLRRWMAQADADEGLRQGLSADEGKGLVELRHSNRVLERGPGRGVLLVAGNMVWLSNPGPCSETRGSCLAVTGRRRARPTGAVDERGADGATSLAGPSQRRERDGEIQLLGPAAHSGAGRDAE